MASGGLGALGDDGCQVSKGSPRGGMMLSGLTGLHVSKPHTQHPPPTSPSQGRPTVPPCPGKAPSPSLPLSPHSLTLILPCPL